MIGFVWDFISHIFSYREPFDGIWLESFYVLSREPSDGIDLFRIFYPFKLVLLLISQYQKKNKPTGALLDQHLWLDKMPF